MTLNPTTTETQNTDQLPEDKNQQFSWKRIGKISAVIILIAAFGMAGYFFVNSRPFKIWTARQMGHHLDFLPCEDLPFYGHAQKVFSDHQDTVEKLKQAGAFNIEVEKINCPSFDPNLSFLKGDLNIEYSTIDQRKEIENILGKDFFGIPYNGYNR